MKRSVLALGLPISTAACSTSSSDRAPETGGAFASTGGHGVAVGGVPSSGGNGSGGVQATGGASGGDQTTRLRDSWSCERDQRSGPRYRRANRYWRRRERSDGRSEQRRRLACKPCGCCVADGRSYEAGPFSVTADKNVGPLAGVVPDPIDGSDQQRFNVYRPSNLGEGGCCYRDNPEQSPPEYTVRLVYGEPQ